MAGQYDPNPGGWHDVGAGQTQRPRPQVPFGAKLRALLANLTSQEPLNLNPTAAGYLPGTEPTDGDQGDTMVAPKAPLLPLPPPSPPEPVPSSAQGGGIALLLSLMQGAKTGPSAGPVAPTPRVPGPSSGKRAAKGVDPLDTAMTRLPPAPSQLDTPPPPSLLRTYGVSNPVGAPPRGHRDANFDDQLAQLQGRPKVPTFITPERRKQLQAQDREAAFTTAHMPKR